MEHLIEVKDVHKHFQMGKTTVSAINGIDLIVDTGEKLMLGGASGSGKSTLLNMVGCLDMPTKGSVLINGTPTEQIADNDLSDFRAKNVGFVFQNFNLLPVLNVFENVEYPLMLAGVKNRKELVNQVLEEVGLIDYRKHYPGELSGGQRQRVAIARGLVNSPRILIADEPTANLDSKTGATVLDLMFKLVSQKETTLIMITHDEGIMSNADRLVMVGDGKVISDKRLSIQSAANR